MEMDEQNVVVYNEGELELRVSVNEDTVWLTQKQIAELFDVKVPAISKHIKNIYKDRELNEFSTVSILEIVQIEGNREVIRKIEHYNLDIVLAIGYRTNSAKAIRFRQWATKVLKTYIQNGYAINHHKITEQRLSLIENDLENIKSHIKNNILETKQGIFYNGQIFDAHNFVSDLIRSAKSSIILIDNYIDDTTLSLFSKNQNINITIYTHNISKSLKVDIEKYKKQYNNLEVKISQKYHDRFLIIDKNEVYHIGASLKDLGNKVFAFSKLEMDYKNILK
jgi:prophage antirepressor-like protein